MIKISEYYGSDAYSDRESYIYLNNDDNYVVEFIKRQEGKIIHKELRDLAGHSVYYAEDAAENWVFGVIN